MLKDLELKFRTLSYQQQRIVEALSRIIAPSERKCHTGLTIDCLAFHGILEALADQYDRIRNYPLGVMNG